MNIVQGNFVNDVDLAICIFPTETIKNKELAKRMVEYTKFYALRFNQLARRENTLSILECDSIDDGMSKYHGTYKNILFMAAGVRIYDMSILFEIREEILSSPNYMAFGHILEWKEDWYELHHQFVLVNSRNWIKCGKPSYGAWEQKIEELPVVERSEENFHDDYTPLWIRYTGEYKPQKHTKQGWNYFNASSRGNCEIGNWNDTIRSKRTYYYPENNGNELLQSLKELRNCGVTNPNQIRFINTLRNFSDQIWVLNSEEIKIDFNNKQYSFAAFPAAGFKFLEILHRGKLKQDGKIVIYDFNPKSIQWIETLMHSNKNPLQLMQEYPHKKTFKCLGGQVFTESGEFTKDFLESYQRTVSYFGGEENFNKLIEEFRKSNVVFVQCDLFNSPETLCSHLSENGLINISNIFCTDFSNGYYGLKETQARYKSFIKLLPEKTRVIGFGANCETLN
jgi:hypothetical protein